MKGFILPMLVVAGCTAAQDSARTTDDAVLLGVSQLAAPISRNATPIPEETHLRNVRQLTFGGQNAEAYLSADGTELIYQSQRDGHVCDAIYRMNIDGSNVRMVSNGRGNTTCSFIAPDGKSIIYASTHLVDSGCPPKPDMSRGYVWALYQAYDIFKADPDGANPVRLTTTDGYDAECVFSPDGSKILFTSVRSGDLEIWMMNADGTNPEQLTNEPGYDGGSFFSPDGKSIVWRVSRPVGEELKEYRELLKEGLIHPRHLEIYTMSLVDRKPIQLTDNGAANFAPYFHPDGKRIIFCSNVNDPKGRNFDLYLVAIATRQVEQVTYNGSFDGFPMFTRDGKTLVFASNREGKVPGETNIFVADWVE
jgi:Tol biopolymer transport system component